VTAPTPAGTFWPTRQQELLLETALGNTSEAEAAWREVRPTLDLQTVDDATFAALPLVYRALEAAVPDEPLLPRLKGIYRSTWARNALLADRLDTTAASLAASDVPVLLVGGIGAARRYYPAFGLRPTAYIGLLVREHDAPAAAEALGRSGWVRRGAQRSPSGSEPLVLFDGSGNACVLRTTLALDFLPSSASEDGHEPLWEAATQIDANGAQIAALCPTDDLLAAIVLGARVGEPASIQWIVDAAMITRAAPDQIDWDRLVHIGVERGQGLRLRDALGYLDRLPGPSTRIEVRRMLDARRPGRRERLTYACTVRTVRGLGSFPQALGEHLAQTSRLTVPATIAAFPGFMRTRWQLEHNWQVPVAGARRAFRNLARRRENAVDHT
jgi:hypothetical protein